MFIQKLLETHGFKMWGTGGGCGAYGKSYGTYNILITDEAGCGAPNNSDEVILVGIQGNTKDNWDRDDLRCDTIGAQEVLNAITAMEETIEKYKKEDSK